MKQLIAFLALSWASIFAKAAVTQLHCTTIDQDATVHVQFDKAVDPANPWVGWTMFHAVIEVRPARSAQVYRKEIVMTPLNGIQSAEMRGDATEAVYLRLAPVMVNGQATGAYTGQLFVNDLDVRAYYRFMNDGAEPGLRCH
jgi:hypothetical protein